MPCPPPSHPSSDVDRHRDQYHLGPHIAELVQLIPGIGPQARRRGVAVELVDEVSVAVVDRLERVTGVGLQVEPEVGRPERKAVDAGPGQPPGVGDRVERLDLQPQNPCPGPPVGVVQAVRVVADADAYRPAPSS